MTLTAHGTETKANWLGVACVLKPCACTLAAKRSATPGAQEPRTDFGGWLRSGCDLRALKNRLHSSASYSSVVPEFAALCAALNLLTFKRAWFDVPGWF
jgi:hypothetical protein